MRNFLEEVGRSSSDEGEEERGKKEEKEKGEKREEWEEEEDRDMADIEARIEKLKDREAAEEKRCVWCRVGVRGRDGERVQPYFVYTRPLYITGCRPLSTCRELRYLRKQRRKVKKRLTKDADAHKEAGEITRQEHLFALKVRVYM